MHCNICFAAGVAIPKRIGGTRVMPVSVFPEILPSFMNRPRLLAASAGNRLFAIGAHAQTHCIGWRRGSRAR